MMTTVGDRLKTQRERIGLTLEDVGSKLGMGFQQYWRYEKGDNAPSFETLRKLATIYNVSLDYLGGLVDDPTGIVSESDLSPIERRLIIAARNKQPIESLDALTTLLKAEE